jgi:hypothetical protein
MIALDLCCWCELVSLQAPFMDLGCSPPSSLEVERRSGALRVGSASILTRCCSTASRLFRETLLHYGYIDPRINRFILCCDNARFINH